MAPALHEAAHEKRARVTSAVHELGKSVGTSPVRRAGEPGVREIFRGQTHACGSVWRHMACVEGSVGALVAMNMMGIREGVCR
jgi:hypothetical protein